jgi:hypothetical protein
MVREARGRGGRIPLFCGSGVHQFVAHGVAKPEAKIVGVAHSSADPSRLSVAVIITEQYFEIHCDIK